MDKERFKELLRVVKFEESKKGAQAQPQNAGAVFEKVFLRNCQEDVDQQEKERGHGK